MDELNLDAEEPESSVTDGTTSEEAASEPSGETVAEPVSSEEGTTTEPAEPDGASDDAAAQEQERQVAAFRDMQARADRAEQQLAQYQAQERAKLEAELADENTWIDKISNPQEAQQILARLVDARLADRDMAMAAQQEQIQGMEAANRLREFALKEAGMSEPEYQAFLFRHTVNGVPFMGYPPQQAEEMAKALIRDLKHDAFASKQQKVANEKADKLAKQKLLKAVPSGAPVTESGKPKTSAEIYREQVTQASRDASPDAWLQ